MTTWKPEHFVRCAPLPLSINGVTLPNDDGTFDIYINSQLSDDAQKKALCHEIEHIQQCHFYNEQCIARSEAQASGQPAPAEPSEASLPRPGKRLSWPFEDIPIPKSGQIVHFFSLEAMSRHCAKRNVNEEARKRREKYLEGNRVGGGG